MRRYILSAIRGALYGVAAQYLLALFLSVRLRLGYLMTCVPALQEAMHGEINAAILEAALCALTGAVLALVREKKRNGGRRRAAVRLSSNPAQRMNAPRHAA